MKIAIDLRALQVGHENRGIGNYLLNILRYFPKGSTEYIIIRYSLSNPVKDYSLDFGSKKYQEVVIERRKFAKNPKGALLFAFGILTPVFSRVKKLQPDIFFQPDFLFGLPRSRRIKKVVVVYDIIPLLFRNMYLPSWRRFAHLRQLRLRSRVLRSVRALYHEKRYKRGLRALRRANRIISISETTTTDLTTIVGIKPKKIRTIHLAPSFVKTSKASVDRALRKNIDEIQGKYLLFIGGTDPRRQVHELVFAFNLLNSRGHDIHLVLGGNEFVQGSKELSPMAQKAIDRSSFREKIHMLGRISESDKKYVLENALAFVYPTLYEGFGLPILESMQSGCPVIAYDNPATREVAGGAAMYTIAPEGASIYDSVIALLHNNHSNIYIERGLEQAKAFDWDTAGEETINYLLG